jgi:hypothetical protein
VGVASDATVGVVVEVAPSVFGLQLDKAKAMMKRKAIEGKLYVFMRKYFLLVKQV